MGRGKRINWNNVRKKVKEALKFFEKEGVKPTLRTLFYWLVSKEVIPNTRNYYTQLSSYFVEWRKQGLFSWDAIADQARRTLGNHNDNIYGLSSDLEKYREILNKSVEKLTIDELLDRYIPNIPNFTVDRWYAQPTIPEIWIEKEALAETIYNWVKGLGIKIRVNRGYSSWSFLWGNINELKQLLKKHDKVIILYCGDYDPSGIDMDRFLSEALDFFGMSKKKIIFKRLAVTESQIERFKLPPKPENAETIEKLARDPRSKRFFARKDFFSLSLEDRMRIIRESRKFVVELDALVAYVPTQFKKLIRDTVKSYWNENIYRMHKREIEKVVKRAEDLRLQAINKAKEKLREVIS